MPYSAKQVSILQAERTNDPLVRGYSGMDDAAFLTSITTADRTNARTIMSSGEIFEQLDQTEFAALTAADQARVDRILGLGAEVIVGPGNTHAVQEFIATFGSASATLAALQVLRDQLFTRAEEIGLPIPNLGDVQRTS